jgi:hypothetical protein
VNVVLLAPYGRGFFVKLELHHVGECSILVGGCKLLLLVGSLFFFNENC